MKKGEKITERFIEAFLELEAQGVIKSRTEAGTILNCSPQSITEIVKKRQMVTLEILHNFFKAYKVNPDFIFSDSETLIKSKDEPSDALKDPRASYKNQGIPLIPIEAMAGFGKGDSTIQDVDISRYIIPEFKGVDFLIKVKGSSMYPKYSSGDIVACKYVKESQFIQWGKVYVLDSTQGAIVKRLFESKKPKHIECRSDNTYYPPFDIPTKEIHAFALVVGVIRLE